MIRVKRASESADGNRFWADRLWPRRAKQETLRLNSWLKDVAPSDGLRVGFLHGASSNVSKKIGGLIGHAHN